jgi:hypothetical protein
VAYRAQIAEVCGALLVGEVETATCYTEVLKLSAKPAIDGEAVDADGFTARQRSCRGDLRALDAKRADDEPRKLAELGPGCNALAQRLRSRCVTPLGDVDVQLPVPCGSWLMNFQTIVRGLPERRETACTQALANLADREGTGDDGSDATGDDSGG